MTRLFDPASLTSQVLKENATRRTPMPIGETTAQIQKIEIVEGVSGPNSKQPGKPWYQLKAPLEITDPEYLAQVGDGKRDKAMMFLQLFLDVLDGQIATGDDVNVQLGKLRSAAGVNGQPLDALVGQYIRIAIGQKPHPTEVDENGQPTVISEVVSFTKV